MEKKFQKIASLFIAFLFLFPVLSFADNPEIESQNYQHFIMYGQSLSTGHEAYPVSMESIDGNYMLGEQIWINYGNRNFTQLIPLSANYSRATKDVSECPLHGAVNHIRLKQKAESPGTVNRFIATSAGTSGMPIEELSKESTTNTLYKDFQNTLKYGKNYATQTNSTITCPAIFWLQGEWNYQGHGKGLTPGTTPTADKDAYKELLITLKNNMQQDAMESYGQSEKPLFITYQVGAQYTSGIQLNIGMAQLEASNEHSDIICAGPIYPMTDVGGHLDGNGYRWYGEMLGKVYYKTKILGEDFKPLQPKRLAKDKNNPKKIYITYHVPEPPLVLDEKTLKKETNFGFNIYKNNRVQSIAGVEIINDTTVAITSFSDLSDGKIAVAYGGASTRGHGNLRDSDPYQSFFNYENPDQKDNEGNFVFDHGSKASLVPPSGEPKGNDGKVIYGKPYPLYNFSVAFYYEVTDVDDSPETDPDPEDVTVPGTTRADLEAALNKAQPGDVILISESITLDDVFQCNKKVTFRGVGEDIRIDGGDLTKLLELNSSEGDAAFSMVFENLTFTGGNNEEDGGVGRIIGNGPVEFRNCIIENNYSANRGGAFFLDGSPEVSFVNCKINNNQSNGQGGAFFVAGNSVLNITDCEISGNNSFGERGGAFFLAGNSKTQILRTSIANNSNGDPQNPLDLGGGAFMMYNTPTLTVTSSSVIDNFCNGGHGSVMFSAGESNITFINTTIAGNKITTMASASFFLNGKTDLTFVNVTMAGNHSQTNNAGNSTGINILNAESKIRIYNSLLVGNTNPQGAVDITIFIPEVANAIGNILDVKNSIIGHIYGLTADQLATILPDDKDGLNASKINAYELTPNWQSSDVSGIDWTSGLQQTYNGMDYYMLTNDAYAKGLGNPELLATALNMDETELKDQLGSVRKIEEGAVFAGAFGGAPMANLIVTEVSWEPAKPKVGENVTFIAKIKNIGYASTQPVANNWKHGVRFYVDGTPSTWCDSYNATNQVLAPGEEVTLTANGGPGGAFWTAQNGTFIIQAEVNDTKNILEGDYTNNTKEFYLDITSGLSVNSSITDFSGKIYSYNGKLIIEDYPFQYAVSVYNMMGRKIVSREKTMGNLSLNLPVGVYVVKIQSEGKVYNLKVLIP